MNRPSFMQRQLFFWGLILGIWCLTVLGFSGQLMVARSWSWREAIQVSLHDWLPWVVLAPGVAWLSIQFPLERRKLFYTVPIHVAGCALAVLIYELISREVALPEGPPPMEETGPRFPGPPDGQRRPFRPGPGPGEFPPDRPGRPGEPPLDRQPPLRDQGADPASETQPEPERRGPSENWLPNEGRGPNQPGRAPWREGMPPD